MNAPFGCIGVEVFQPSNRFAEFLFVQRTAAQLVNLEQHVFYLREMKKFVSRKVRRKVTRLRQILRQHNFNPDEAELLHI